MRFKKNSTKESSPQYVQTMVLELFILPCWLPSSKVNGSLLSSVSRICWKHVIDVELSKVVDQVGLLVLKDKLV